MAMVVMMVVREQGGGTRRTKKVSWARCGILPFASGKSLDQNMVMCSLIYCLGSALLCVRQL